MNVKLAGPARYISPLLLLLLSCQEYPFLFRPHQRVAATKVREIVLQNNDTDVLFVIDNSGSMTEEQDNLVRNTRVFIEELARSDNAYRVGVITTDFLDEASAGTDGGRLRLQRASQVQLDAAGCGIAPSTDATDFLTRPDINDAAVTAKRCRLVQDFIATVEELGIRGSGTEAGLEAARKALNPTGGGSGVGLNPGFLRDEADLAIIFLTDEDDCSLGTIPSAPRPNSTCYEPNDSAVSADEFVDFFSALKGAGGIRKVRMALIAGGTLEGEGAADFIPRGCRLDGATVSGDCGCWTSSDSPFFCEYLSGYGNACESTQGCLGSPGSAGTLCASSPGATCDTNRCDALPGSKYYDVTRELRRRRLDVGFSAGVFEDSICKAEYDDTLLTIARTVVLSACFSLEEPALGPESVFLIRSSIDAGTGEAVETVIPRFAAGDATADCSDCASCASGAWQYVDAKTLCLECGLKKLTGDEFLLTVLNETVGVSEPEVTP